MWVRGDIDENCEWDNPDWCYTYVHEAHCLKYSSESDEWIQQQTSFDHFENITSSDFSNAFGLAMVDSSNAAMIATRDHGCQMARAGFLDQVCLALQASGLWIRYATLQI